MLWAGSRRSRYAEGSRIIYGWDAGNAGKRSFPAGTATDDSDSAGAEPTARATWRRSDGRSDREQG